MTHNFGGEVLPSNTREYGRARLDIRLIRMTGFSVVVSRRNTGLDVAW
ncbi:MAG: hypothetical protein MZV63_25580 [Marinilabiliales bacterium]|nr:hypothetical protein [Marinilabiliales bacterium]